MTKDNYKRLFNNLQEENMILKDRIDKVLDLTDYALKAPYIPVEQFYKDIKDILEGKYD